MEYKLQLNKTAFKKNYAHLGKRLNKKKKREKFNSGMEKAITKESIDIKKYNNEIM